MKKIKSCVTLLLFSKIIFAGPPEIREDTPEEIAALHKKNKEEAEPYMEAVSGMLTLRSVSMLRVAARNNCIKQVPHDLQSEIEAMRAVYRWDESLAQEKELEVNCLKLPSELQAWSRFIKHFIKRTECYRDHVSLSKNQLVFPLLIYNFTEHSALYKAIYNYAISMVIGGKESVVQELVKEGLDLESSPSGGCDYSLLETAIAYRQNELVQWLYKYRSMFHSCRKSKYGRIALAVNHNNNEIIRFLITQQEALDEPLSEHDRRPALYFALRGGNVEALKILQSAGLQLHSSLPKLIGDCGLWLPAEIEEEIRNLLNRWNIKR